jgi:putative spermidine/putrescine transport system permease protein
MPTAPKSIAAGLLGSPEWNELMRHGLSRIRFGAQWLVAPALLFMGVFFLVPIGAMVFRSLTDPSPINYWRFLETSIYPSSLFLTLWMSMVVTLACLLIGYPYAYAMYRAGTKLRLLLWLMILLPFWSSLLVRTYAWTILLRDTGVINWLLQFIGLIDQPIGLMGNKFAVIVGMTHVLLPFMVLPISAAMQRVDATLLHAAASLGASPASAFRSVFLPLTLPGVIAGSIFVFVSSVGFYVTPAVLGGRTAFFSLLIVAQINRLLDFGFGSTLGVILLAVVLVVVAVGARFVPAHDLFQRRRR